MFEEQLVTIIKGYEPFDLLRLSKDAFYDVVAQQFPELTVLEMNLSFDMEDGASVIRAELTDYKKVGE